MLRVAVFGGGGEASTVALDAVSKRHEVVAVVRAAEKGSRLRRAIRSTLSRSGLIAGNPLASWAREHAVPLLEAASGGDRQVEATLKGLAPDVICASAFPWMVANAILKTAGVAAVNVHPSLLPRHRGPVPLFWIYYHDDRETGVTVHLMNEHADRGAIVAQEAFELPRGFAVDRLHATNANVGARLLLQVLENFEAGRAETSLQDEVLATNAPHVKQSVSMVNFAEWHVERVWHFLSGLCPRFREPLRDRQGRAVGYASVLGYEECAPEFSAGSVTRASHGWNLYCRNGRVQLGEAAASGIEAA